MLAKFEHVDQFEKTSKMRLQQKPYDVELTDAAQSALPETTTAAVTSLRFKK